MAFHRSGMRGRIAKYIKLYVEWHHKAKTNAKIYYIGIYVGSGRRIAIIHSLN